MTIPGTALTILIFIGPIIINSIILLAVFYNEFAIKHKNLLSTLSILILITLLIINYNFLGWLLITITTFIMATILLFWKSDDNKNFIDAIKGIILFSLIFSILTQFIYKTFFYQIPDFKTVYNEGKIKYMEKYEFNIDSLGNNAYKINNRKQCNCFPPFVVFNVKGDSIVYDYEINKSINKDKYSFKIDSLNSIIYIENIYEYIGDYQNKITSGYRVDKKIKCVNIKNKCNQRTFIIKGENPPHEINYRRNAPDKVFGQAASINTILKEIESQNSE